MDNGPFEIESKTLFSESLIWNLNRDFYQEKGIKAWSEDIVPHHMTSNSFVGQTYAEMIFAFLKDLANKGQNKEVVYLLELGAGHGRLAFHILKHLEKKISISNEKLPPYCYVLSDIAEDNLSFFENHKQFQTYFKQGLLDVAYFDAIEGKSLELRKKGITVNVGDLEQPILAIANYFFDSIPCELFYVKDHVISESSISIHSKLDPKGLNIEKFIENTELTYHNTPIEFPFYADQNIANILDQYKQFKAESYIYFPKKSMECLSNIKTLSKKGLALLTMDKGFHEMHKLMHKKEPDLVTHGCFSLWANYHALSEYCLNEGGKVMFSENSTFHLEVGCLLFLNDGENFTETHATYQKVVNDFGPDDFNSLKQLAYSNIGNLRLVEMLALYRLSAYDATIFLKLLPRLKQVKLQITYEERRRLAESMHKIWDMYFNINEKDDLSYEMGGILYDLGMYQDAMNYFQFSIEIYGDKADVFYNQALCFYQLRQDQLFYNTLEKVKTLMPNSDLVKSLESLDMN